MYSIVVTTACRIYLFRLQRNLRKYFAFEKIDAFCDQIENKLSEENNVSVKQELIALQYKIRERRENGFLIPDWFYKMRKGKQQKQEDCIAETIVNLSQENGEHR